MPIQIYLLIAILIIITALFISLEIANARRVANATPTTPTAPPPAVVNMPEPTGINRARGKASRRLRRGTGPMGRKL